MNTYYSLKYYNHRATRYGQRPIQLTEKSGTNAALAYNAVFLKYNNKYTK